MPDRNRSYYVISTDTNQAPDGEVTMTELFLNLNTDQIMLISFIGLMIVGAMSVHGLNKIYDNRDAE